MALHHRRVVGIGHNHVLRMPLVGVADHAEHGVRLRHAVYGEAGVEYLVATVLTVGLGKHHQLDIGGVAAQLPKGLYQVVDFVYRQGQAELGVGLLQRLATATQQVNAGHGLGRQSGEQGGSLGSIRHHTLGHPVVQHGGDAGLLPGFQRHLAQQARAQVDRVLGDALDAPHRQAAVVGNVSRLGSPRRHRAQARCDYKHRAAWRRHTRLAILQKGVQARALLGVRQGGSCHQMHKTG